MDGTLSLEAKLAGLRPGFPSPLPSQPGGPQIHVHLVHPSHCLTTINFAGVLASPENVTEILALISHPNQDQFHLLARFRWRFIRRGVEQSLGHDATPVLHPALQRSQLSIFEPARIGLA